jgi:DNA-binding NarL/FixJ family response regulator
MPKQIILALVVAKPGHLCNGLQSLLRTVPQIEIIAETQDPSVLLKIGTEMQPELVLLDASLFDEDAWTAITKIKDEWPQTQCIALVDNDQQRQNAQAAGVDLVLPKGYPAQKLVAIIENIIDRREDTPYVQANTEGVTNSD